MYSKINKISNLMKPWLSVLMPVYNGEKYLSEMLTSVVEVNDHRIECIIVDDGSTDNSANIVKSFENELNITFLPYLMLGIGWRMQTELL